MSTIPANETKNRLLKSGKDRYIVVKNKTLKRFDQNA
jgi:hypothetical protein